MNDLIGKIREYKAAIKKAIIDKYEEININNPDKEEINPGDNLFEYASFIKDNLSLKFEENFREIGYDSIPKELLLTLQGQTNYNISLDNSNLSKSLFVGANFKGDLDNNRRCILLFTNSLKQYRAFNNLKSLQEIYVVDEISNLENKDITNPENFIETKISTYWFFRDTTQIQHIYAILDMDAFGYTLGIADGDQSEGNYFFGNDLKNGNVANAALVPSLTTLYMKNIHRAYNFGNSPLSMDSVLYCIRNAKRDEDYAINEKTDEKKGTYKFTLNSSVYTDEQKDEMAETVKNRAAALGGDGLNMEIVFV